MPEPKVTFIVRGPFCWGAGATPEVALRNARKEWHSIYGGKYSKAKTDCMRVEGEFSISPVDGSVAADKIESVWKQKVDAKDRKVSA